MAFLFPFIKVRNMGSWCPKLLREANIQELFPPPLGFCCHLSCPKQTSTWPMPHMFRDCSSNCSPFPRGRKLCPRQRRPENQVLHHVVSINLLLALGRELLRFKVVALVASCPAAALIVPMLPLGVSLFWCDWAFCLFRRKLVSIYLWEFSVKLM